MGKNFYTTVNIFICYSFNKNIFVQYFSKIFKIILAYYAFKMYNN